MECDILRVKTTSKLCHFKIPTDPHWEVIGRRIHGIRRCHFSVYRDGILQYILSQPSLIKHAIVCIPLMGFFYLNPFCFFRDGVCCGHWHNRTKFGQASYEFVFEENTYTLTLHSNGVYSFLKNEAQVAVYRWEAFGKYRVKYSPIMEEQHDILLLFGALIENWMVLDNKFGSPRGMHTPYDRVKERIYWLPEDEVEK